MYPGNCQDVKHVSYRQAFFVFLNRSILIKSISFMLLLIQQIYSYVFNTYILVLFVLKVIFFPSIQLCSCAPHQWGRFSLAVGQTGLPQHWAERQGACGTVSLVENVEAQFNTNSLRYFSCPLMDG